MNEKKYTIQEITDAVTATVNSGETGNFKSEDEGLNDLVTEIAGARMNRPYYIISQSDIDSYLEDRIEDASAEDKDLFEQYARKYIDNCGGFSEYLSTCLGIAFEEAELTDSQPS